MRTITIDILNEKALKLLKDLELMKLIRLRKEEPKADKKSVDWSRKYKGAMTKQSPSDIDEQLNSLRSEWD